MNYLRTKLIALAAGFVFSVGSAFAAAETIEIPEDQQDDVTAELVAGVKAYLDGNIAEAKSTLEFAVQLISQLKAKGLSAFLPAAISDEWTRTEGDTQAVGAAMFGGGISASAKYAKGSEECTVTITGDSPMIQSFSMMLSNPAIASASGNSMKRVNGERVMISSNGEIQTTVNNFFIQYAGNCSEEDKLKHVENTDFAGLKAYQ